MKEENIKKLVEINEIKVSIKVLQLGKKSFTKSIFNQLFTQELCSFSLFDDDEEVIGYVNLRAIYDYTSYEYWLLTVRNGELIRYFIKDDSLIDKMFYYEQIFITS